MLSDSVSVTPSKVNPASSASKPLVLANVTRPDVRPLFVMLDVATSAASVAVPAELIVDNRDEWRGDHCIDPGSVPGVLLANRKAGIEDPRIEDLTVTILEAFGIGKEQAMKGRNLYAVRQ